MSDDSKVVMMTAKEDAADGKPADPPPAAVEGEAGGRSDGRNGDKGLTPQQLRAVLLLATGWRPAKVVKELDIDPSTLCRWRHLPAFAAALEEAVNDFKDDMMAVSRGNCNFAMETLHSVMAEGPAGASVSAAAIVLRMNGLYKPR